MPTQSVPYTLVPFDHFYGFNFPFPIFLFSPKNSLVHGQHPELAH